MKTQEVREKAGVKIRIVQSWAKSHGVKYHIENMKVVYDFTEEEVEQFLNRDTKRGRRWPKGNDND
jgi:predicted site-specific integrase-resolvase